MSAGCSGVWHRAVRVASVARSPRLRAALYRDTARVLVELADEGQCPQVAGQQDI